MKSKTCCFTGHRRLPEKEQTIVKCKLEDSVESLIQNGYRYFGAGGAIGFDCCANCFTAAEKISPNKTDSGSAVCISGGSVGSSGQNDLL